MNIQKFFTLTVKVILLLAVILIFSYVNTKKSHIEKVEKIRKKGIKEGNLGAKNGNTNDDKPAFIRVAEIVDRSKQILENEKNQENTDKDNIDFI